jgi:hypothetical protein
VYEGETIVTELIQANWLNLLFLAAVFAMFLLLRNRATHIGALEEILGKGQPVIVEVFSNT